MSHGKQPEKQKQTKPKARGREETTNITAKQQKLIQDNIKDQRNKHFFFENINKIDKPLARITKKREDQNKLNQK